MHCSEQNASVCATPTIAVIIAMHIITFLSICLHLQQLMQIYVFVSFVHANLAWPGCLRKRDAPKHAPKTTAERNELTFTTF